MVYEEEDFQLMHYGYSLNPDVSEQRIISMLREVEEDLQLRAQIEISEVSFIQESKCD